MEFKKTISFIDNSSESASSNDSDSDDYIEKPSKNKKFNSKKDKPKQKIELRLPGRIAEKENEYTEYAKALSKAIGNIDVLDIIAHRRIAKRRKGYHEPEQFIVSNGKRGTGKSFSLDFINWQIHDLFPPYGIFPIVMVCTETQMNFFWQQRVPKKLIHEGMPATALRNLIESQAALLTVLAKDKKDGGHMYKIVNPYVLLILDDTITADGFKYSKWLQEFAAMGRHLKIMVQIATQYPKAVSTLVRENVDWAQIHNQRTERAKEGIVVDYLGFFSVHKGENTKIGQAVIKEMTQLKEGEDNPENFWIDNRQASDNPVDIIKRLPMKEIPHYQLGVPEIWSDDDTLLDNMFIRTYPPGLKCDLFEDLEFGSASYFDDIKDSLIKNLY